MAPKKSSRGRDSTDDDFRRTMWFCKKIQFLLRGGNPLSQSALFIGLAKLDGRPHPENRGHPSLLDSAAALGLKELIQEGIVEKSVDGCNITFCLTGRKSAVLARVPKATNQEKIQGRPKSSKISLRLLRNTPEAHDRSWDDLVKRIDQIEAGTSDLKKRLDNITSSTDDFDRRRALILEKLEKSLVKVESSAIVGGESS